MAGSQGVLQLNEKQKASLKSAQNGHNLLITGQCGTGKTHLLRYMSLRIVSKLPKAPHSDFHSQLMAPTKWKAHNDE